jgi:hypothetical protein
MFTVWLLLVRHRGSWFELRIEDNATERQEVQEVDKGQEATRSALAGSKIK